MSLRPLSAVVLAAGEGTRMHSALPKPLHRLCGRPMVLHVLDALAEIHADQVVVVVGHGADQVVKVVQEGAPADLSLSFVEQRVPKGTGDAVAAALTGFPDVLGDQLEDDDVVILPGDAPLLRAPTLAALVRQHRRSEAAGTLLTAVVDEPMGYGRIVRAKDGRIAYVVEEDDASPEQCMIKEVNTSIYCFRRSVLAPALRRISPDNTKGEYYLTDVIAVLHDAGYLVSSVIADDMTEAAGVNDRSQLAAAESVLRARLNERWMRRGVTMVDPEQTYLDASVELAHDVTLLPGTILSGTTAVETGAEIGPNTWLVDCLVAEGATITSTVAVKAAVGERATVGPFAVLDPGFEVPASMQTGPFFRGTVESPGAPGQDC